MKKTFTHQICERCWFAQPGNVKKDADGVEIYRVPVQLRDADEPVGRCCFCGSACVTRIFTRMDPNSELLTECHGEHPMEVPL